MNRRTLLLFIFVIFYGRILIVQVLTALLFRDNKSSKRGGSLTGSLKNFLMAHIIQRQVPNLSSAWNEVVKK